MIQEKIRCSIVLDNDGTTWEAYDKRYWSAWHLIDADGLILRDRRDRGGICGWTVERESLRIYTRLPPLYKGLRVTAA
jgi:hypothetical protein